MTLCVLLARSADRARGVILASATLLAGFQLLVVRVAAAQYEAQSFDLIMRIAPSFLQRQLGSSMPLLLSFPGLVTFGYFHPVIVLTLASLAAFLGSELAGDVEARHVDLLLARPVARHALVTRSLALVVIVPVLLVTAMMAATWGALAVLAPAGVTWPPAATVGALGVHLTALAWCFGATALALASFARRRSGAHAPTVMAAVSLYLLDLLAGAWPAIRPAAVLSPFHYYQGTAVLAGSANLARDLITLVAIALGLIVIAYSQFNRRDV